MSGDDISRIFGKLDELGKGQVALGVKQDINIAAVAALQSTVLDVQKNGCFRAALHEKTDEDHEERLRAIEKVQVQVITRRNGTANGNGGGDTIKTKWGTAMGKPAMILAIAAGVVLIVVGPNVANFIIAQKMRSEVNAHAEIAAVAVAKAEKAVTRAEEAAEKIKEYPP